MDPSAAERGWEPMTLRLKRAKGLTRDQNLFCRLRYSVLSAFMGEIDAARLAGIMAAKNAQMASALAATPSASGSQLEMP